LVRRPDGALETISEADCRQIKTKSEYNTFIERQKELVKEASAGRWIEWKGGRCPLAMGTRYEAVRHCGDTFTSEVDKGDFEELNVWEPRHFDFGELNVSKYRILPSVVQSGDE
jgi:hypothetical protein